jgi:DNA-binding SARP family transcriptional activator
VPLSLTLLGGFQARLDSGAAMAVPTKKAQALLAYLALPPGRAHPRDKLAAFLWGDAGEARARDSFRHTLVAVRRALAACPSILTLDGQTLALDPGLVEVDAVAFAGLATAQTPEALEQAASLYRGDLLEGLAVSAPAFDEWLLAERERLRELVLQVLARLFARRREAGAIDAAIQTALRILALDPLQEPVHRALMRLYAQAGRRGAALRQYQHCVAVLRRELGVEPELETKTLYQDTLRQRTAATASHRAPVAAEAAAATPEASPARDLSSADMPLVGRQSEMARLGDLLEEARRGHGGLAAVVGEAGIGKSRLLTELAAVAVRHGDRVLIGRCYESDQILPFAPWVDALRAGHVIPDDPALGGLDPAWRAELGRLFPEVDRIGLPSPGDDPRRLFESVTELLASLTKRRTVLLVLEDLHWADEMSLRLLAFVARRLSGWRTLVVVTAREEDLADVPLLRRLLTQLKRDAGLTLLEPGPLSRADTETLVRALGRLAAHDSDVARLSAQIWAVSEGNPLVITEVVQSVQEPNRPVTLPDRVREVIAGRLERLSERGRDLVAAAAVIGREFEFALLQRVTGMEERDAAEGVEELVRRRVLHAVGEGFDFTHDRLRRVAYEAILPPKRRLLHGATANAIEQIHATDLVAHVAGLGHHHYEAEAWGKAVGYLREAGRAALAQSAHREAMTSFTHAIDAIGKLPESRAHLEAAFDLRLDLRQALFPLRERVSTLDSLREAQVFAEKLGDQWRLGRVLTYIANELWIRGDQESAAVAAERALEIGTSLGDRGTQVLARFRVGQVHHERGRYRDARVVLAANAEGLRGASRHESFGLVSSAFAMSSFWLALALSELGEFTAATAVAAEALATMQETHSWFGLAHMFAVGRVHIRQGMLDAAEEVLERGGEICQTRDFPMLAAVTRGHLGYAYVLGGRVREGLRLLAEGLSEAEALGILFTQALWLGWLAEAESLSGAPGATLSAQRALGVARERGERGNEAYALRVLGELEARADRPDVHGAAQLYRQSMAIARELGMGPLLARCHAGLGRLHERAGKREEGEIHLRTATTMFREMGMRVSP